MFGGGNGSWGGKSPLSQGSVWNPGPYVVSLVTCREQMLQRILTLERLKSITNTLSYITTELQTWKLEHVRIPHCVWNMDKFCFSHIDSDIKHTCEASYLPDLESIVMCIILHTKSPYNSNRKVWSCLSPWNVILHIYITLTGIGLQQ